LIHLPAHLCDQLLGMIELQVVAKECDPTKHCEALFVFLRPVILHCIGNMIIYLFYFWDSSPIVSTGRTLNTAHAVRIVGEGFPISRRPLNTPRASSGLG